MNDTEPKMIRPSDTALKLYEEYPPVVSKNMDNLLADFGKLDKELHDFPGPVIDLMFGIFVCGVTTVLDPKSSFNSKHRAQ